MTCGCKGFGSFGANPLEDRPVMREFLRQACVSEGGRWDDAALTCTGAPPGWCATYKGALTGDVCDWSQYGSPTSFEPPAQEGKPTSFMTWVLLLGAGAVVFEVVRRRGKRR